MTAKFDQLFKEFSGLNHDDKKQKLVAILDYIKDKMDMAQAISTFVKNSPNVTDDFLERNYSMIMSIALESNDQKMTADAKQRLEKIASIKKMEQKDHEEADSMLNIL